MGRFADRTSVPIERSQREVERMLERHGAKTFYRGQEDGRAIIGCQLSDRRIQFEIPLPHMEGARTSAQRARIEQTIRAKWRALVLAVKAKLISVDSGVETFEEAFMAQLVVPTPDGAQTMSRILLPRIAEAYRTGHLPPLLPAGGEQ